MTHLDSRGIFDSSIGSDGLGLRFSPVRTTALLPGSGQERVNPPPGTTHLLVGTSPDLANLLNRNHLTLDRV